ncbi:F-box and leucine-rich repeat protein 4 [Mactra antiquata]
MVLSSSGCIIEVVKNCLKLKKLFLTANRTVEDNDLMTITEYSSDMEQLDILGNHRISFEAAEKVLEKCENLKFFDVSFCGNLDKETVLRWTGRYPHVAIKRSFQEEN